MNNEPVAIVKKITIGGIDNFPIEQYVRLKEGTLLYTHPVNPYQSITNTKIEPTVVSYTHLVKELTDEEINAVWFNYKGDIKDFARAILRKAQEK